MVIFIEVKGNVQYNFFSLDHISTTFGGTYILLVSIVIMTAGATAKRSKTLVTTIHVKQLSSGFICFTNH